MLTLPSHPDPVRVAILDLYNGEPNQGMRALRELLDQCNERFYGVPLSYDLFDVRSKAELPGLDYDIYLSSGGPGSPFDGENQPWEARYFSWLESVWNHNEKARHQDLRPKHVLFICHSFQIMTRFFEVAQVIQRRSESFGIFPVYRTVAGMDDPLFSHLPDPFYGADFRHWQVVQPDHARMDALGAEVLAIEKMRAHVPLERAIMAMRISPELIGVQFHPEADPPGMRKHFADPERKALVIRRHGEEKYNRILYRLSDPTYLKRTHDTIVPNFLLQAIEALYPEGIHPPVISS